MSAKRRIATSDDDFRRMNAGYESWRRAGEGEALDLPGPDDCWPDLATCLEIFGRAVAERPALPRTAHIANKQPAIDAFDRYRHSQRPGRAKDAIEPPARPQRRGGR